MTFFGHGQALANATVFCHFYLYRLYWATHIRLSCNPYIAIASNSP